MKKIWTLLPVLLLALACQMEQEAPETPAVSQEEETFTEFYATAESQGAETKVYVDTDLHMLWTADDQVSIFRKDTGNNPYRFTGETGANAGTFEEAWADGPVTGDALARYYSVYPYMPTTAVATDGTISLSLPAVQAYAENTFGLGANTMVAVSDDNFLPFKNVGSYLILRLFGDGISVSSISIQGKQQEKLAGPATVQLDSEGIPTVSMSSEGTSTEVSLVCESPVALGADSDHATAFWLVLPPTTFEGGFTITIEDSEGNRYEKATTNRIVLNRNGIARMAAFQITAPGFGIYPASAEEQPFIYDPATDQMNIYEAEGKGWFRFLHLPDLTMYELGPIPLDEAQWAEGINATLTVTTEGAVVGTPATYALTVQSFANGKLTLTSGAGDRFIIRF